MTASIKMRGRHADLPATGTKLVKTRNLRPRYSGARDAGGHTHARVSGVSGGDLHGIWRERAGRYVRAGAYRRADVRACGGGGGGACAARVATARGACGTVAG